MTITYFNDMNVYFHMKNHYKMLKQVKSVIDTSIPQSLLKSPLAMHSLQKRLKGTANENLRKIYNSSIYMPKPGGQVKRHNCVNSEARSEASIRPLSRLPRPTTRRNNPVISPIELVPSRSCSGGPPTKTEKMFKFRQKKRPPGSSTRSSNAGSQSVNSQLELEQENEKDPSEAPLSTRRTSVSRGSPKKSPQAAENSFFKESSEEHEYLLFLLRITEDIIVNDFYSNSDIKQVFKFHVEANKQRLNIRKMHFHIGNLCKELNIDCKEYQQQNSNNIEESTSKFINSPESRARYLKTEAFTNCSDCSTIRTSSLYNIASVFDVKAQGGIESSDNDSISPSLLKLLEKLSLGRVTECTEPAASTSTMNSPNHINSHSPREEETAGCVNKENSPVDFDTFVKELNSQETVVAPQGQFPELNTTLVQDNSTANPELLEVRSSNIFPQHFLTALKFSDDSKSEIEISEKDMGTSEKYETDFEKTASSVGTLKCDTSEKSDEEKVKEDEKTQEKSEEKTRLSDGNETLKERMDETKEIVDYIIDEITKDKDSQSTVNDFPNESPLSIPAVETCKQNEKPSTLLSINSLSNLHITPLEINRSNRSINMTPNLSRTDALPDKSNILTENELIYQNEKEVDDQSEVTAASDKDAFEPVAIQSITKCASSIEFTQNISQGSLNYKDDTEKCSNSLGNHVDDSKQDTTSKVILQGSKCASSIDLPQNITAGAPYNTLEKNDDIKKCLNSSRNNVDDSKLGTASKVILEGSKSASLIDLPPNINGAPYNTLEKNDDTKKCLKSSRNNADDSKPETASKVILEGSKSASLIDLPPNTNKAPYNSSEKKDDTDKCLENHADDSKQDTLLKVILQGSLSESDYVMIQGPVYIYRPLLESEPKLIVFNDHSNNRSRPNSSACSHQSNETFTVENTRVREQLDADQQVDEDEFLTDNVDEAIQLDQNLHSLADDSMENIMELTRRAYTQFTDSKLLQSDYDLTPQKDFDHKYHHLLLDATTSVSGVNIKESLLLSDEYLVKTEKCCQPVNENKQVIQHSDQEGDYKGVHNIDSYLQLKTKLFDDNYENQKRKKLTSASMPKLLTVNDNSGDKSYELLDGNDRSGFRNIDLLLDYTKDLMDFDIPSQDSSLRSEGETYQNLDKKSRFPWSNFN